MLEGGSIHVDGKGTLLTTRECLLNPNRNPDFSQAQIEDHLVHYLDVEHFIWLNRGIFNDETNGHVDNIACFLRPGEVALAWTDDRSDPQYDISAENYDILRSAVDARGRSLVVHKIPLPSPVTITLKKAAAYPRWKAPTRARRETAWRLLMSILYSAMAGWWFRPLATRRTRKHWKRCRRCCRSARWRGCTRGKSCSAAATSTALRSRCLISNL